MSTPNFAGRRSQGRAFRRIQAEGNADQGQNSPTSVNSPRSVVRSIASGRDEPDMLALTLRVWVIGSITCGLNAFLKARAQFETDAFDVPVIVVQFLSLFAGHAMAAFLPKWFVRIPFTRGFKIPLNPGEFTMKEHALITVFDLFGRVRPNVLQTISIVRAYYNQDIHFWGALTMTFSSHFLCFLFVGLFLNWVSSPDIWWPSELTNVIFFRTWHAKANGPHEGIPTRRYFLCCFFWSLVYQLIPGYFFPSIGAVSVLCLVFKESLVAQQIGDGINGLGLFSFSLDWSSMSDFVGDPLSTPRSTIYNVMGGLLLLLGVVTPIINWTNAYETKSFPLSSVGMHDSLGLKYNLSRVMSADGITFDEKAYDDYSRVYFSALTIASYCFKVGSISAGLVYVAFNFKRLIWNQVEEDVHNRLMRQYRPLSRWWLFSVFGIACSVGLLSSYLCSGHNNINLPPSILLLSCIVALVLVPPLGIFAATTNQMIPVDLASRLLGGYIYPNTPFQGMIFDGFANQVTINTVSILGCMKMGHYIKVDPKATYTVVVAAMIIGASVGFGETWYRTYPGGNSCSEERLPTGNCPWLDVFYYTTNMWVFLGSDRILSGGNYDILGLWFIVTSVVAQVLLSILSRKWKFLQYINLPIVLAAASTMPPARAAYLNSWLFIGIVFPLVAYKYFNNWTSADQFLLSVAISAGTGFMNFILFASKDHIKHPKWWGSKLDNYCKLAKNASAPHIRAP